ncbi:MAG: hypothetical protein AAF065_14860 [Verrucomicrobiota bacterium]
MDVDGVYYSLVDVGSSATNMGDLGSIPLKLIRGKDHIHVDSPKTTVKAGDYVPVTFEVLANNTGIDSEYSFELDIPDGLALHEDNVLISSSSDINVEVADGKLTLTGTQLDTSDIAPDYIVTNSITDVHSINGY